MTPSTPFRCLVVWSRCLALLAAVSLWPALAGHTESAEADPAAAARMEKTLATVRGFHPKESAVALPGNIATVKVPAGFCFLDAGDSRQLIVDLWRNPPGAAQGVLGMILPTEQGQPDVRSWGVIITYEKDGYVKDNDADSIDYGELLKKMQTATAVANEKRKAAGYPSMELVGWAAPPRYDKANKKLYWAKELKSGDVAEHTLNYDIRILGRDGVLSLNAVAGMDQLAEIEQSAPRILSMVEFDTGHRYADFNPKTDKVAEYGLAALVAGGILAKVGGFKFLIVALLAAKKFVVIGVVAAYGLLKKIFGGRGPVTHALPGAGEPKDDPSVT